MDNFTFLFSFRLSILIFMVIYLFYFWFLFYVQQAKLDKSHNGKPSRVIHIRNIASEVSESEIINLGMPFGRVTNVLVLKGKNQVSLLIQSIIIVSISYLVFWKSLTTRWAYNVFARVVSIVMHHQKQSNHSTTRQSNNQPPFTHYLGKLRFALGTCCGLKRKREFATKATTISTPIIATRDPSSQSLFQSGNCLDSQSSILRIYMLSSLLVSFLVTDLPKFSITFHLFLASIPTVYSAPKIYCSIKKYRMSNK